MNDLETFLRFSFAGLSIVLAGVSFASFTKIRQGKLALASVGFSLFAVEGTLLTLGTFLSMVEAIISMELLIGMSLVALIFFYLSILKR